MHEGARGLYSAVPMALARDGSLSAAARSVALYVWSHDCKWQQSRNDIAAALEMSVNTATKALNELEASAWMVRNPRARKWHLQVAAAPFSEDQVRDLSGVLDQKLIQYKPQEPDVLDQKLIQYEECGLDVLDQKLIQYESSRSKTDLVSGSETDPLSGSKTDLHSSTSRSAPEVHLCRSTSKEPEAVARPLTEEVERPKGSYEEYELELGGSNPSSVEAASAADDDGPQGLSLIRGADTQVSATGDPFASTPTWLLESRASDERRPNGGLQGAGLPWD